MNTGMRVLKFNGDQAETVAKAPSPQAELEHFRAVTNSVAQDALTVWADIWAELENGVACGVAVVADEKKGFNPSCGWPELLEKMWVLRHHLDFVAKYSRQERT